MEFALERISENFACRIGKRREGRRHSSGNTYSLQPLERLLPSDVVRGLVVKREGDYGEPEHGRRPQVGEMRRAIHLPLDGQGNGALYLFGGVSRPLRNDLDVDVLHIGERVDWQIQERVHTNRREQRGGAEHEQSLAERETDQATNHERALLSRTIHFASEKQTACCDDPFSRGHARGEDGS